MILRKYLILFVIYIFTIFLTVYLCLLYKNSITIVNSSDMSSYISDVTDNNYDKLYNNISNYSDENDIFYLYVVSYKFYDLSSFERHFKAFLADHNIKNIIYVNVDEFKNSTYLKRLISDFGGDSLSIGEPPLLLVFKRGVITDVFDIYEKDDSFLKRIMEVNND